MLFQSEHTSIYALLLPKHIIIVTHSSDQSNFDPLMGLYRIQNSKEKRFTHTRARADLA